MNSITKSHNLLTNNWLYSHRTCSCELYSRLVNFLSWHFKREKLDEEELAKEYKLSNSWVSFHTRDHKGECSTHLANREMRAQLEELEQAFTKFTSS